MRVSGWGRRPDPGKRGAVVLARRLGARGLELSPYGIILALVVAGVLRHPAASQSDSHFGRMVLALGALLLLHITWRLRLLDPGLGLNLRTSSSGIRKVAARCLLTAWVAAAVFAVANYYQFSGRATGTVTDYGDATYYYLNSKYFEELGYTQLYRAMLVADSEGPGDLADVSRFRDLVDYEHMLPRQRALRDADAVKEAFSSARWEAFKADLAAITRRQNHGWSYFFSDHGYNPPPPWTLVGGTLAQWIPVAHMKLLTSIDTILVAAVMLGIARVVSPAAMCMALTFFCCTFSGRWPMVGQAVLRFDWLCALVGAALMLRRRRHAWAGALLTYATCVRIFPGIFALPYVVVAIRDILRAGRLPPIHRRFAVGAGVMALLLVGGSLYRYGPDAYVQSAMNLKLHASPDSFSSHRVGLGDALLYRGEWSDRDLRANGGMRAKRDRLWELNSGLKALGVAVIALLVVFVARSRQPPDKLLWLGVYPLFVLTNPQINYYNLRLLLVLLHLEHWDQYRHRAGLFLLFLIEVVTQGAQVAGAARYAVTASTSFGIAVYLTFQAGFLMLDLARPRMREGVPKGGQARCADVKST